MEGEKQLKTIIFWIIVALLIIFIIMKVGVIGLLLFIIGWGMWWVFAKIFERL